MDQPQSLLDAVRYFSDLDICDAYMRRIKWPSGKITCPKCDSDQIGEIKSRRKLQCRKCRKQFSYKTGTIFESSPLGLDKWFVAVWAVANCKNGISSHELGRALGVQQRTAWFMLHRIRRAMETDSFDKFGRFFRCLSQVAGKRLTYRQSRILAFDASSDSMPFVFWYRTACSEPWATPALWGFSRQEPITMAKKAAKPKGWRAFHSLAKKLVNVPKEELETAERKRKKRRRRK